jgi:hypothetical protein
METEGGSGVLDVIFVVLTLALFGLLALVLRGVEHL